MKPSLQIPPNAQYSIQETDDSYIVRFQQKQFIPTRKVGLFMPWWAVIAIIAALFILFIFLWSPFSDAQENERMASIDTSPSPTETYNTTSLWKESGFLFPDSDTRCLDENDVLSLSLIEGYTEAELLRFAVNEIYARHHYSFTTDKYIQFFNSYDWYSGYLGAEDAAALFNSTEHQNIAFLLKIEAQYQ